MSDLSDRLARAKDELGFSTRQISSEAEKAGYKVSNATAAVYTNGKHGHPDPRTVEALSVVLRVPLTELRELAGLPVQYGKFEPAPEADSLTRQQRDVVNEVIKMIAAGNQKAGDGDVEATSMNDAGGKPAEVAEELVAGKKRLRAVPKLEETELFTPPPPAEETAALYGPNRGRQAKEEQDRDAEGSQDPEDEDNGSDGKQ